MRHDQRIQTQEKEERGEAFRGGAWPLPSPFPEDKQGKQDNPSQLNPQNTDHNTFGTEPFPTGVAVSFLPISKTGVPRLVAAGAPPRAALTA